MTSLKKGDFIVGLPEADREYKATKAGVLCFVVGVDKNDDEYDLRVVVLSGRQAGHGFWVNSSFFRAAKQTEIDKRLKQVAAINSVMKNPDYAVGKMVRLNRDYAVMRGFLFFAFPVMFRKGALGVVDTNPMMEKNVKETDDGEGTLDKGHEDQPVGDYHLRDFIPKKLSVYFIEAEDVAPVAAGALEAHVFDENLCGNLVLPNGYLDRILTTVSRVLDKDLHKNVYEKLGLSRICQKGRGAVILLYGPPGTGKTMTAESVAERVHKPLIRVNIGNLMDGNALQEALKSAFARANKYDGILLLDEVDVFIRQRGENFMMDQNTSIFLRVLEYYDGILFLTTNLVNSIDHAVFSRVHLCLGFEKTGSLERRAIWSSMLEGEIRKSMRGNEKEFGDLLDNLSAMDLNGREIKMVIQNAITRAVKSLGTNTLPEVRWIPMGYFVDEAQHVDEQKGSMKAR